MPPLPVSIWLIQACCTVGGADMYAPHTVTVYSTIEDSVTFEETRYITVLHGVFMDASKAANVRTSGLEGADSVNLFIPFSVRATDGVSLLEKRYVDPKEFGATADKSGIWTLRIGDFFVKGDVVEDKDQAYMEANYDDVYRITKVDKKDFGSESMRHFEVGGA